MILLSNIELGKALLLNEVKQAIGSAIREANAGLYYLVQYLPR